jgi:hypothetical protein
VGDNFYQLTVKQGVIMMDMVGTKYLKSATDSVCSVVEIDVLFFHPHLFARIDPTKNILYSP